MYCCNKEMKTEGRDRYHCPQCGSRPRLTTLTKRHESALNNFQGNITKAAKSLGLSVAKFKANVHQLDVDVKHRKVRKAKRYIITAAQDNTPSFAPGWNALHVMAEWYKAEIIVIPLRYKNPTSIFSHKTNRWAPELLPYLCDTRTELSKHLMVMADYKIIPTAVDPLSSLSEVSGKQSAIFGHTSLSLKTVPVATGEFPKILCSTGAITVPNYTDSKQGKRGEFHHVQGAQFVEVAKNGAFHIRQLNMCKDGSFIDLDLEFTPNGVYYAKPGHIVLGDLHHHALCPQVKRATFNSLIPRLKPKTIVYHDAYDFYGRNHHHRDKPFLNYAKHHAGITNVRNELVTMFDELKKLTGDALAVFPYSNHPAALYRWIEESNWKNDPENAEFYLETALAMVRGTKMQGHKSSTVDPFIYWGKREMPGAVFLGPSEPYMLNGIRVDMHGHIGANGARGGTVKSFSELSLKNITGHGHGPGIFHGAYRVGTSSVYDQEYVQGPSSWLNTHCVIYSNGKRSLINIINGSYTL